MKGNDTLTGGSGADSYNFNMVQAKGNDGHDTITDFVKAEDILCFSTGDANQDGKVDISDLLADVKSVTDHGAGKAVDVMFANGSEITFTGCGTGAIGSITDLADVAHIQVQ
jgi:Ca2+-binding RTX toxin-like protein